MNAMFRSALLAVAVALVTIASIAQTAYPSRPIKLIVPFPPGGGFDGIVRPFAERLAGVLGQPVVVENRAGAGGNIGAESVARASADGYTLLFANDFLGTNPSLYKAMRYDPLKDFAPISMVGSTQLVIATNPGRVKGTDTKSLQLESLQHVLQYGTPGVGTSPHLFGELYGFSTGTKVQHVPYKGTGAAVTDAVGGQIDFVLVTVPAVVQQIRGGRLRAIAVIGGGSRSLLLPDVPTLAETGVTGVDHDVWYGLFAPANTAPDILQKLREATHSALAQPQLIQLLNTAGYRVVAGSAAELRGRLKADLAKWAQTVERAKLVLD